MSKVANWREIAVRAVNGLNVQPRELILIRDGAGDQDILNEVMQAIDQRGATPLVETVHEEYLRRLLQEASPKMLTHWDYQRQMFINQADRILVLGGMPRDLSDVPAAALKAWQRTINRLMAFEDANHLPYLLVTVPTHNYAEKLGFTSETLTDLLLPALRVTAPELRADIDPIRAKLAKGTTLTLRTYDGEDRSCDLRLLLGNRRWMIDDGNIDDEDRRIGAITSNLPAGSIYITVLEKKSIGTLLLASEDRDNTLQLEFVEGSIVRVNARDEAIARQYKLMLNSHTGHSRRVGHIGIGLNRYLTRPIGWTAIDEHVQGAIFLSLGENRFMGGKNRSSLNIDYAFNNASLFVDEKLIVERGHLIS